MRFPLGFGILLVLILGLVCVSPSSSYSINNEDNAPAQQAEDARENKVEDQISPSTDRNEAIMKRGMGMPDLGASREMSDMPKDVSNGQQNSELSALGPPINQPNSVPDPSAADSTQQQASPSQQAEQQPDQSNQQQPQSHQSQPQQPTQESSGQQTEQTQPTNQSSSSTARGFGVGPDDTMAPVSMGPVPTAAGQAPEQLQTVRQEDLPTIIEKDKAIVPDPTQNSDLTNVTTTSTARTFDSWTHCVGASSNKYGTCKNDVECNKSKGRPDGTCMAGFGVCCVVALSCGDKSVENNTLFANPDFPEPSWEARLCEVEVKKKASNIVQIMIEFEEFELAPPNHEGECITDVFQVKLASKKPSPYSLLRVCGQNTGQHMYLDVSQVDEPIVLSVATSGGGFPRRWSIRIVQMDDKNHLLAPPGCLQYYTDTVGHFRSFNLGKNLKNLYYAICFRIDNGYSGIRFTENFFGMNGPSCRKRIGGGRYNGTIEAHPHHLVIPPPGYAPAYPKPKHHVPPPPPPPPRIFISGPPQQAYGPQGYGPPPAGVGYTQPQQQAYGPPPPAPRYKRLAYFESLDRVQRTLPEHEKGEEKEEHKMHHHHHHHPAQPEPAGYVQPAYGPPGYVAPAPTYEPQGYGPPPPPPGYGWPPMPPPQAYPPQAPGYQPEYPPEHIKNAKFVGPHHEHPHEKHHEHPHEKHHEHHHEKHHEHHHGHHHMEHKLDDGSVWKGKQEMVYDEKYGPQPYAPQHHNQHPDHLKHGHHNHQAPGAAYGPQGYGGPPPAPAYGPPAYGQQQGSYGPQGYGGQGYAAGEYHHKEIDKFGKKYEHLENKHEHNHHHAKKPEPEKAQASSSGWWPSWGGSRKDDKKEKFFQHHEALFPMIRVPEMPHCEPRYCGASDVITFPPSGDSISEMCGNRFNRGRGPKIISGTPLVVYVSNRGYNRGGGFDMNYEQVFYVPNPY